ncbi:5-oxoprolinase subunit C family protein [Alkaliphilus crotonatoxidans]
MSKITILKPGLLTTIQDQGRIGHQQYGVPQSGAMDLYSLELANLLVGNPRYEAGLELTLVGPAISFHDRRIFAITGADLDARLNGRPLRNYQSYMAQEGDVLEFTHALRGCRGYLAIQGGFAIESVMGSKSTYLRGGFGGYRGRALRSGDEIPLNSAQSQGEDWKRMIPPSLIPDYGNNVTLRVILGPEEEGFTAAGIETFLRGQYEVTSQSDRMGYRLMGPKIEHSNGADIISGGINMGAIQIPGEGNPIIMLADRQTTGGYTKIANVISVDLPYLAQLKPGDKISFKALTVEEAQKLFREREKGMLQLMEAFSRGKHRIIQTREMRITLKDQKYHVLIDEVT